MQITTVTNHKATSIRVKRLHKPSRALRKMKYARAFIYVRVSRPRFVELMDRV